MDSFSELWNPAALGLLAGFLCAMSTVPEVVGNLLWPGRARKPSVIRNLVLATGNATWIIYGAISGLWPVWFFCGLNFVLISILISQQVRTAG